MFLMVSCRTVKEGNYCNSVYFSIFFKIISFTDESWIELPPEPNSQNDHVRCKNWAYLPCQRSAKNAPKKLVAEGMTTSGLTGLQISEGYM